MMKKLLSLCLAVVLLLGIFAMGVSAVETDTENWKEFKLLLDSGVSMKFVFENLDPSGTYTIRFTSTLGEVVVPAVAGETEGEFYGVYSNLNPAYFDLKITAEVVETGDKSEARSVLDYCEKVTADPKYSDEVHAIAVDLMNYAAAVKTWQAAPNGGDSTVSYFGRELTYAETEVMEAIKTSSYALSMNFSAIGAMVCEKLGLTFSTSITPSNFRNLFNGTDDAKSTLMDRSEIAEGNHLAYDMIVPNSWGGACFAEGNSNTLTAESFKPGDMILIRKSGSAPYWTLVYTGNDLFAAWTSNQRSDKSYIPMELFLSIISNEKHLAVVEQDPDTGEDVTVYKSGYKGYKDMAADDLEADSNVVSYTGSIDYYLVFRPSQVLPNYNVIEADKAAELKVGFMATVAADVLNPVVNEDQTGKAVQFGLSMPILGESIGYRFYIDTTNSDPDALAGATFKGQIDGGEEIPLTPQENANGKYVDFTDLTPDMLDKVVTIRAYDSEGTLISIEKKFSGAAYAEAVLSGDYSGNLKSLVSAMMVYSVGVENYIDSGNKDFYTTYTDAQLVTIQECTNFAVAQYRMEQLLTTLTADQLAAGKAHADYITLFVYRHAGLNPKTSVTGLNQANKDVNSDAKDPTHPLNVTVVPFDSFDDLQVGDLILPRHNGIADYLTKEGTDDKTFIATYTNMVYIGNETFICGERGVTGLRFMTFDDFDDPTTPEKEDIFDASLSPYFITLLRLGNLIGE